MIYEKTNQLLNPILNKFNQKEYLDKNSLVKYLADLFSLDDEFLNKRYEISNVRIFDNTVQWKLNDLEKAGLIEFITEKNKRKYRISELGKRFLNSDNESILEYIKNTYYRKVKSEKLISKLNRSGQSFPPEENFFDENFSPLAQLEKSYKILRAQIYEEILDTILCKSSKAFEQLVTELLQKMGYGDGEVTQFSRDGGIDATIKGDVLGFEQIYVQAKRYQRDKTIGRPEIQGFTGALLGLEGNATKGVFITTAKFSSDAENFAKNFSKARIVLIDGSLLAKYIYEYELGVQVEKQFSVKKLDNDFWDSMPND